MFSIEHLNRLRQAEIEKIAGFFPPGARILEIGAGTGQQANLLQSFGFDVEAIEIPDSNYVHRRVFTITDYDGSTIPFPSSSFDVVFTSNVLEHVPDLPRMHQEIRRVLRPHGYCIHVLPTHAWRLWTTLSAFPAGIQGALAQGRSLFPPVSFSPRQWGSFAKAWLIAARHVGAPFFQRRHGERGNLFTEVFLFHPRWWRRNFQENGFSVEGDEPMGLFYTGNMVFAAEWSLNKRARLAGRLGSACHLFKISPTTAVEHQ